MNFKEWLLSEMPLTGLRIDPSIATHPGEVKMLGGDKLKKCLEDKFRKIEVPVKIVVSTKPTEEEKTPEQGVLKILLTDRGGDPMTCWMILHRVGHATNAAMGTGGAGLDSWFKEYVKYHPEWLYKDDLGVSLMRGVPQYAFSKFLKFLSAKKTALAADMWRKNHPDIMGWKKTWQKRGFLTDMEKQPGNWEYYNAMQGKSYSSHQEFEHELVAEFLWNGRIRVEEDSNDPYVRDNPGVITKIAKTIEEEIRARLLKYVGRVVQG